jgi:hypothetical protein
VPDDDAQSASADDADRRDVNPSESAKERVDRELIELLNELRVALPGVQVLFAFLLTVPFARRFADTSDFQRDTYLVTLISAAVASGLLMAPAAQHRALFRARNKENLLHRANRYAFVGFIVLAVAIAAAALLVVDFLFGRLTGLVTGIALGALLLWWWTVLPLLQRRTVGTLSELAADEENR